MRVGGERAAGVKYWSGQLCIDHKSQHVSSTESASFDVKLEKGKKRKEIGNDKGHSLSLPLLQRTLDKMDHKSAIRKRLDKKRDMQREHADKWTTTDVRSRVGAKIAAARSNPR